MTSLTARPLALGVPTVHAEVRVLDNAVRDFRIEVPAVREGTTATGTIYLSGHLLTPLTIQLTSANPGQLAVPQPDCFTVSRSGKGILQVFREAFLAGWG